MDTIYNVQDMDDDSRRINYPNVNLWLRKLFIIGNQDYFIYFI